MTHNLSFKIQINGDKTAELTQNDVVERLKKLRVGDSVNLLISRIGSQENENQSSAVVKSSRNECLQGRTNEATGRYGYK